MNFDYVRLSPNYYQGPFKKDKITWHHTAGVLSAETLGAIFASPSRQASCNIGVDKDARSALIVPLEHGAWTSSSYANDTRAVTFEISNSSTGGDWPVSDAVYEKAIQLTVEACKEIGLKELVWTGTPEGSLTCHYMFAPTGCPGPFLKERMAFVAKEVTRRLNESSSATQPSSDFKGVNIEENGSHIYRLCHEATGFHMYTTKSERDALVKLGWKDEDGGWKSADTGLVVYRFVDPNTGDHMWTTSFNEAATLYGSGWEYEGSNFASARDGKPVYRLYHPNAGFHFWTISDKERDALVKKGWNYEGIGFYAVE